MVADRHRLRPGGVHDGEFHVAMQGGVEQAALELVPAVELQHGAAILLRDLALQGDGGGQVGGAAEAGWAGGAAERPGIDRIMPGMEVVEVDHGQPVGDLAVGHRGQRQSAEEAEKGAPGEHGAMIWQSRRAAHSLVRRGRGKHPRASWGLLRPGLAPF